MAEIDFELPTRSEQAFVQSSKRISDEHAQRLSDYIDWERYEMDRIHTMPHVSFVPDEEEKSIHLVQAVTNFFINLFYRA